MERPIDHDLLERLNRLSVTRSFTPQIDVDWSAETTDAEFAALYPAWSLFHGTGVDDRLDGAARIRFAKYQQMNLMAFTGLLERHAVGTLARVYDLDPSHDFSEYVGHFIKEEIYHHMLFTRAVEKIRATMPGAAPLPLRRLDRAMRAIFALCGALPGEKLRSSMTFMIIRFAEQVTIYAHRQAQETLPRKESFVAQVWAFHAIDESRHLAFDAMVLERNRLPGPLQAIPRLMAAPLCVLMSLLLNANELWAARQVGLRVGIWQLPALMRRTEAPFKRRVFELLSGTARPSVEQTAA